MSGRNVCGYPTGQGTPCQNRVALGDDFCKRRHGAMSRDLVIERVRQALIADGAPDDAVTLSRAGAVVNALVETHPTHPASKVVWRS